MKKIECSLKEEKLKMVIDSLLLAGVPGVTITKVEGFGRQRVKAEPLLRPKVKIEIYAEDRDVDTFVKTLVIAGRAGKLGDGKIAVLEVNDLVRIRTAERGEVALY